MSLKRKINNIIREGYLIRQRMRLKNKDICLISSNCNGGCILHDLHLRFNYWLTTCNCIDGKQMDVQSEFKYDFENWLNGTELEETDVED